MMTKKHVPIWMVGALILALSSCSSSQTSEGEHAADPTANAAEAGTDAVPPPEGAEAAPPTADSGVPPALPDDPNSMAAAPADPLAGTAPGEPPALPDPGASPTLEAQQPVAPSPTELASTSQAMAPTPAPEPAPLAPAPVEHAAAAAPSSEGTEDYTVHSGDTLMKISFETYGDLFKWRQIYEANRDRISDPNNVPPGTVLKLEKPSSPVQISRNGKKYLIKSGDTLGTISDDVYGTTAKWRRLWDNNREMIKDPNRIFAGFTLYYTMTPADRQELEQFRSQPAPLAKADDVREPASATKAN